MVTAQIDDLRGESQGIAVAIERAAYDRRRVRAPANVFGVCIPTRALRNLRRDAVLHDTLRDQIGGERPERIERRITGPVDEIRDHDAIALERTTWPREHCRDCRGDGNTASEV